MTLLTELRGSQRHAESLETLQADLDVWVEQYNTERTHQGKMCCGRTLIETLEAGKAIWKEKLIA